MLLVFHVGLTLLVNMGPRTLFVTVLHDSSVQSGSGNICTVFLRLETKHSRPLLGEYWSSWHCSWWYLHHNATAPYIYRLLSPINITGDYRDQHYCNFIIQKADNLGSGPCWFNSEIKLLSTSQTYTMYEIKMTLKVNCVQWIY